LWEMHRLAVLGLTDYLKNWEDFLYHTPNVNSNYK